MICGTHRQYFLFSQILLSCCRNYARIRYSTDFSDSAIFMRLSFLLRIRSTIIENPSTTSTDHRKLSGSITWLNDIASTTIRLIMKLCSANPAGSPTIMPRSNFHARSHADCLLSCVLIFFFRRASSAMPTSAPAISAIT